MAMPGGMEDLQPTASSRYRKSPETAETLVMGYGALGIRVRLGSRRDLHLPDT